MLIDLVRMLYQQLVLSKKPQIFVEGMYKYLNLSKEVVDRIFPCIDKMIDIHMSFLEELRIRQSEQPVVTTIADILCRQFSSEYYSHLLFIPLIMKNTWIKNHIASSSCHLPPVFLSKIQKLESRNLGEVDTIVRHGHRLPLACN